MLGIGPAKDFQSWMNVFEKMASFKPKYIIPGHGSASGLSIFRENPVIAERLQSLFIHGTKCGHFNTFFEY
jgi:hypothetical protein